MIGLTSNHFLNFLSGRALDYNMVITLGLGFALTAVEATHASRNEKIFKKPDTEQDKRA